MFAVLSLTCFFYPELVQVVSAKRSACNVMRYIFGEPEVAAFVHRVGFSQNPSIEREFDLGADCFCQTTPCYRRQSEYCIKANNTDDRYTQTYRSYNETNSYTEYVRVVFVIDGSSLNTFDRLSILTRTCYPYLAVFCAFRGQPNLYPWMRQCCDAVVIASHKLQLNESSVIYHDESKDQLDEAVIFTLAPYQFVCGKCGVASPLSQRYMRHPEEYRQQQASAHGKHIPIVVRHRDAYFHYENGNEPLRINVTGGFEPKMVAAIASELNFTYFYIGNRSTLTTGGDTNTNGTFNGMLDLLMKRTAIISLGNQKPIHPGDELFTFSSCYDVDILPFASRVDLVSVTIDTLFKSLGGRFMTLLLGSIIAFAVITYLILCALSVKTFDLLTLLWFFSFRLIQSGLSLRPVSSWRAPIHIKWLLALWGVLTVVFSATFNAVWVTFTTTPPFKGVIDTFVTMMAYVQLHNTTCYMSSGLVDAGQVYGPTAKVIFDHAVGTSDAKMIIERLQNDVAKSFWFYEKMFITFQLNLYDPKRSIHISSESFVMQPQCWILQKNCALERNISTYLNYYAEFGLFQIIKSRHNVSDLPPHPPDVRFRPVQLSQLSAIMAFAGVAPLLVIALLMLEIVHDRMRRRGRTSMLSSKERDILSEIVAGDSPCPTDRMDMETG